MEQTFVLHNYNHMLEQLRQLPEKPTVAVAAAADKMVLECIARARKENAANAILVGPSEKIISILRSLGENPSDYDIEATPDDAKIMADTAVELIKREDADFLMKGLIETSDFLRPVVKKENNLRTGRTMSHLAFNALPDYPKLLINTDGGMCTYPNLQTKREILTNAFDTLHALGYSCAKAAVLCCKETVDAKMPETLDAHALEEESRKGLFGTNIVVGPISYDIAMSPTIAEEKHFSCEYCGDFDIILQPNIHAGNILGKSLLINGKATLAGIVAGARIPIVLTSRGSSAEEKFLSIALAALVASGQH